jgi:hypothetical protein
MEILTKDFVEFIECCVAREVKFLVAGSGAVAASGLERPAGQPGLLSYTRCVPAR